MVNTFIKIGAVLLFISVGLWFLLFDPLFSDINTTKQILSEKQKVYDKVESRVNRLKKIKAEYQKLGKEVKKVNEMLPSKPEFPKLLVEMEALIRKSGVALSRISYASPKVAEGKQGLQKYSINLSFSAGYETFKNFLRLQQKEIRLMDIESISFSSGKEGNYDFRINLVTYYKP